MTWFWPMTGGYIIWFPKLMGDFWRQKAPLNLPHNPGNTLKKTFNETFNDFFNNRVETVCAAARGLAWTVAEIDGKRNNTN